MSVRAHTAGVGGLRFSISGGRQPEPSGRLRSERALGNRLVRDLHTLDFSTFPDRRRRQLASIGIPIYVRINVGTPTVTWTSTSACTTTVPYCGIARDSGRPQHAAQNRWNIGSVTTARPERRDSTVRSPAPGRTLRGQPGRRQGFCGFGGGGATLRTGSSYFLGDVTLATVDAAAGATATGTTYDLRPSAVVSVAKLTVTGFARYTQGATTITFR